jgi:recombination protein RecA
MLLFCFTTPSFGFMMHPTAPKKTLLQMARKKASDNGPEKKKVDTAKRAALDGVLNQIERSYGRGSIQKLGSADGMVVDCISSGALTLDAALGGGFPKGRVGTFIHCFILKDIT